MANRKRRTTKNTTRSKKVKKNQNIPEFEISEQVLGFILVVLSVLAFFHWGFIGLLLANLVRLLVGESYQLVVLVLGVWGLFVMVTGHSPQLKNKRAFGGLVTYLGGLVTYENFFLTQHKIDSDFLLRTMDAAMTNIQTNGSGNLVGGGIVGAGLYSISEFLVGPLGTYLVAGVVIILGLCLLAKIPLVTVLNFLSCLVKYLFQGVVALFKATKAVSQKSKPLIENVQEKRQERHVVKEKESVAEQTQQDVAPQVAPSALDAAIGDDKDLPKPRSLAESSWQDRTQTEEVKVETTKPSFVGVNENYQLPPLKLLSEVAKTDQSSEQKAMKQNRKVLEETLQSFGVDAKVVNTILGPAVTKYELHPAIGVKVSKIVNLSDDLALALAAKDLRIEAPIPGKSLVGIEVPNQNVATVSFKSIIAAQKKDPTKPLEVPLGRDISGNLITADLAKMPHLLIAGSTGSGKSVAINGIITSLLMNTTPEQVRLVLVDPKKVELGVYNDVAHLLTPVVTDPKKAAGALHKLVVEMERRYEVFADTSQRNITGYNKMLARQKADGLESEEQPMPYIVAIVDELSDLMMTASNEVEDAIVRLAQMARAAGIHMILATQRPSVDVITGLIKANVPSRMAFAVSSGTDSRTIIDQYGAEKLLGRGDMLFLPMGQNKPIRVQGAFISDEDVENVVGFIKDQQTVSYDQSMEISDQDMAGSSGAGDGKDELYSQVLEFIRLEQKCSISLLQRRFKIGYNRAARIVDDLAQDGLIGPQEGSKPRQVLLPPNQD
ncbi:DNA translocase FtsK [Ligilactobacillus equi]